jgi:hypothetical protein
MNMSLPTLQLSVTMVSVHGSTMTVANPAANLECSNVVTAGLSVLTIALHGFNRSAPCMLFTVRKKANSGQTTLQYVPETPRDWTSISSVLLRDRSASMQPSQEVTADRLAKFFVDKVEGVRAATENAAAPMYMPHTGQQLTGFSEVSIEEVRKFILHSPPKTCVLDPLPTSVLRDVVDVLTPLIHVMCNASLREGHLPSSQKAAVITPIPRKANADSNELKNYKPIQNLTFISKVIERKSLNTSMNPT